MKWLIPSAAFGLLAAFGVQPALSQTNQGSQQNPAAQAGTQINAGAGNQGASNGGQTPVRRSGPNQAGNQQQNDAGGFYPENNNPWFANDNLRNELELDNDQIERLSDIYNQTRSELQGRNSSDKLGDEARSERMRETRNQFDDQFSQRSAGIFRNDNQRNRFNQLGLQRRGYSAFDNPQLQRQLNLNETQIRQLQDLNNNWNSELETLRGSYAGDRTGTEQRFNQLQDRTRTNFEGILNDRQRTAYDAMTGNRFDFGASSYLEGNLDNQRSIAEGRNGTNIGTALNPGNGTSIGTAQNPGGGTTIGTGQNPGGRTGIGTGTGTSGNTGTGTSGTGSGSGGTGGSGGSGAGGSGS